MKLDEIRTEGRISPEVAGKPYKAGYIDGFDGRAKNVWELSILSRLRPGNGAATARVSRTE